MAEHSITIEWFDPVSGEWRDVGYAETLTRARWHIAGLHAADTETQRYRIVETTVREIRAHRKGH